MKFWLGGPPPLELAVKLFAFTACERAPFNNRIDKRASEVKRKFLFKSKSHLKQNHALKGILKYLAASFSSENQIVSSSDTRFS